MLYYSPQNITLILVGDFNPTPRCPCRKSILADPAGSTDPPDVVTLEMPQIAEKRMNVEAAANPVEVAGTFPWPSIPTPSTSSPRSSHPHRSSLQGPRAWFQDRHRKLTGAGHRKWERELPLTDKARAALDSVCPKKGVIFGVHDYRDALRKAAKGVLPKE
jgi:hypothetical protein